VLYAAPGYELLDLLGFSGVAESSPALDRYTSPGRSAVAAVRWRW
jgi:hypothetical protein